MKTLILLFNVSLILSLTTTGLFQYSATDIEIAEQKSKELNKSIFVYYTAESCTPCQLMEEYTFSDKNLIEKVNEKYVTVEIDRDDVESKERIEKYNICCLPSYQVIDPSGNVTMISEGSMRTNDFYNLLGIPLPEDVIVNEDVPVGETISVDEVSKESKSEEVSSETISASADNKVVKSEFKPGRIEVTETTYAEMKAKSVKEGIPEEEYEALKRKEMVKSKEINAGAIKNGEMTTTVVTEDVVIAPSSTYMENEERQRTDKQIEKSIEHSEINAGRINNKEKIKVTDETVSAPKSTYVENVEKGTDKELKKSVKEKSISAGKVGSNEKVKIKEEVIVAPPSTYTETETNKGTTIGVNEKVAEGMISVLTDVNEDDKVMNDKTETELSMMKRNQSSEIKKVSATEEVVITKIEKPNSSKEDVTKVNSIGKELADHGDEVVLSYDVDVSDFDKERIEKSYDRRVEYMQAGAFRNILNADKLRNKLISETKEVIVIESPNDNCDDRKLYKVLIGPIDSPDQREQFVKTLSDLGIVGFSIVI